MSRKNVFKITIFFFSLIVVFLATRYTVLLLLGKDTHQIVSPFDKVLRNNKNIQQEKNLPQKEVFGFLPYWMLKNHKYLRYDLLTTIAYFGLHIDGRGEFVKIQDDGNSELGWLNWQQNNNLERVISEAKRNDVRIALTIIAQDNTIIEDFLNCSSCWETLIANTITEMKKMNIPDLNLDFEYQGVPEEKLREKYATFVQKTTKSIHKAIDGSQVSVDTYAEAAYKTKLHDIAALAKATDVIFIMAYDFHKLTDLMTGPVAPIGGAPDKYKYDLNHMLEDYLRFAPREKLIIGVAYYGYNWVTEDNKLGSFRIPGSDSVGYSKIMYYGSCEYNEQNTGEQRRWDEEAKTPWFVYYDDKHGVHRQCHYENKDSLSAKYDFVKENNLRGVGIWALGYDEGYPELWELLEEKF